MTLDDDTRATVLLTVRLDGTVADGVRPLTRREWGGFAAWLGARGLGPASLLRDGLEAALAGWVDRKVTVPRVRSLLDRAASLDRALAGWREAGVWVLTGPDPGYPERLRRTLGRAAPPVLFGCGDRTLLDSGGIAVVGSRDAPGDDLGLAERLGREAAARGAPVVSGGARGVDRAATLGALGAGGTAVGVLGDDLGAAARSRVHREHVAAGRLALVSPFDPGGGFSIRKLMERNRYVYCLADAAVVVACAAGSGGTWHGAVENLENGWVPLWTGPSAAAGSGNTALRRLGARPLPGGPEGLDALFGGGLAAVPPRQRSLDLGDGGDGAR